MYENPKLNRIGKAEDVILGVVQDGDDMDSNWIPSPHDYGSDAEEYED